MNNLILENFGGHFTCESKQVGRIYTVCNNFSYEFNPGTYTLIGEIDSGGWAITDTLSTKSNIYVAGVDKKYNPDKRTCIFLPETIFYYNNEEIKLNELRKQTCDITYLPLTKSETKRQKSIRKQIEIGIKENNLKYSIEEIKEMFHLTKERFDRTIDCVGVEFLRCNAAIGFVNLKDIFCFSWLSKKTVDLYYQDIKIICEILLNYDKIVILPLSNLAQIIPNTTMIDFTNK